MDITLHYEQTGEGFPLVLLHGNGEDHTYFQHQMEPFAAHYRVIALDTRGHGGSPRGEAPFTLEQFAQDLKDFLDGQGIEKCHLLGFSDGGNVALIFALKYPQYIEKLVLNGANLEPEGLGPAPAPVVKLNNRYRYRITVVGQNEKPLRQLLAAYMKAFARRPEHRNMAVHTDCNLMD